MRIPAEVLNPGVFIREEMAERGWTAHDVAARMGGETHKDRVVDELVVMAICGQIILPPDESGEETTLGEVEAKKLARAFDVSAEYILNLEAAWRAYRKSAAPATERRATPTGAEDR